MNYKLNDEKFLQDLNLKLIELRYRLHKKPEISNKEKKTSEIIREFFQSLKPAEIITGIGGHGFAVVFQADLTGASVLFRCELDGIQIRETNAFPYSSSYSDISHACGHDGHMAILAGLGCIVSKQGIKSGRMILLFQPAEETGEGALRVLKDPKFKGLQPNFALAMHNLPGYPRGSVILKSGVFHYASCGMMIRLRGSPSHAACPEQGNSPIPAVGRIVRKLSRINRSLSMKPGFNMVTPVYIQAGKPAFGMTPGDAEIGFTLRTETDLKMEGLKDSSCKIVRKYAEKEKLQWDIMWVDVFPACLNDDETCRAVENAARSMNLKIVKLKEPLRFSEDFGRFTSTFPGVIFGLGAGEGVPGLHQRDYDFPDDIILEGVLLLKRIYDRFQKEKGGIK
jgi:amidohydrolase